MKLGPQAGQRSFEFGICRHEGKVPGVGPMRMDDDALDLYCDRHSHDPQATDASDERLKLPHDDEDACSILDCRSQLWLSKRDSDRRISWKLAKWDETKLHAVMVRRGKPPTVYELIQPLHAAAGQDDCDTYNLAACARKHPP